jgi:hypothetical protein
MGHATPGMASNYRQRIDDERLENIAQILREWLGGPLEMIYMNKS